MLKHPEIERKISETGELEFETEDVLKRAIEDFREEYVERNKGNE